MIFTKAEVSAFLDTLVPPPNPAPPRAGSPGNAAATGDGPGLVDDEERDEAAGDAADASRAEGGVTGDCGTTARQVIKKRKQLVERLRFVKKLGSERPEISQANANKSIVHGALEGRGAP